METVCKPIAFVVKKKMNTPRSNRLPLADVTPSRENLSPSVHYVGSKRAVQSPFVKPSPSVAPSKKRLVNFNEVSEKLAIRDMWEKVSTQKSDTELLAHRMQLMQDTIDFANLEKEAFKSS